MSVELLSHSGHDCPGLRLASRALPQSRQQRVEPCLATPAQRLDPAFGDRRLRAQSGLHVSRGFLVLGPARLFSQRQLGHLHRHRRRLQRGGRGLRLGLSLGARGAAPKVQGNSPHDDPQASTRSHVRPLGVGIVRCALALHSLHADHVGQLPLCAVVVILVEAGLVAAGQIHVHTPRVD